MLRAHKQAWCWQDEWYGLNIDDIRRLEKETQIALQIKYGNAPETENNEEEVEIPKESIKVQHNKLICYKPDNFLVLSVFSFMLHL